ncbi:hypothetical protein E5288_WYG016494 [Bos mutus]|uniref:Uncharacterized protein n=1 Tax=Bos mutus TaxID=72004 RepID=A0A6B0R9J4_9CETA|nr:hypothetical protein [Bos mutus]
MGQRESQGTGEPTSAIHSPSAFDIPVKEPHQGTTGKKGSQEKDGEQEKGEKEETQKFLLTTFERPRVNRIWSPGKA